MCINQDWSECRLILLSNADAAIYRLVPSGLLFTSLGYRAYACQCSWRSVIGVEKLGRGGEREESGGGRGDGGGRGGRRGERGNITTPDAEETVPSLCPLKWVCGRH